MPANNAFPTQTTGGLGLFNGASSSGLIVGQGEPDPSARYRLRGGILSNNETIPMVGGVGVYALTPPISSTGPVTSLGPSIGRATGLSLTGSLPLAGFSTFDQAYNMVNDPQNTVATAGSGQSVNFYPLGSKARIAVACDPALITRRNLPMNAQNAVSWDFIDQQLVPYTPAYGAVTITGAVWSNTNGGQVSFTVGTDLSAIVAAGSDISVSGVVNTGGASTAAFNGEWVVVSADSTHVVVAAPAAASIGTYASGGTIAAAGGSLNVTILRIDPTGCMVPQWNPTLASWSWNYNGAAALIALD